MDPRILAQMEDRGSDRLDRPFDGERPRRTRWRRSPDFDSLIDLIVQTIQPESWDAKRRPRSVTRFQNNLSLVISQKQTYTRRSQICSRSCVDCKICKSRSNAFIHAQRQLLRTHRHRLPVQPAGLRPGDAGRLFERRHARQGSALASYDPQLYQRISATSHFGTWFQPVHGRPEYRPDARSYAAAIPQFGGYAAGSVPPWALPFSRYRSLLLYRTAQGDRRSNVLQAPKVHALQRPAGETCRTFRKARSSSA